MRVSLFVQLGRGISFSATIEASFHFRVLFFTCRVTVLKAIRLAFFSCTPISPRFFLPLILVGFDSLKTCHLLVYPKCPTASPSSACPLPSVTSSRIPSSSENDNCLITAACKMERTTLPLNPMLYIHTLCMYVVLTSMTHLLLFTYSIYKSGCILRTTPFLSFPFLSRPSATMTLTCGTKECGKRRQGVKEFQYGWRASKDLRFFFSLKLARCVG